MHVSDFLRCAERDSESVGLAGSPWRQGSQPSRRHSARRGLYREVWHLCQHRRPHTTYQGPPPPPFALPSKMDECSFPVLLLAPTLNTRSEKGNSLLSGKVTGHGKEFVLGSLFSVGKSASQLTLWTGLVSLARAVHCQILTYVLGCVGCRSCSGRCSRRLAHHPSSERGARQAVAV